jgi:hypothetical protein
MSRSNFLDFMQFESGNIQTEHILTTGSVASRAGEKLYHPFASTFINDKRIAMEFRFIPKGGPGEYAVDPYICTIDNNNYIKILSSSQQIVVSVNAITHSFSPAVSWSKGDVVDLFIEAGGGRFSTKGKYRVNNGSTIIFNSSSTPQAALVATG